MTTKDGVDLAKYRKGPRLLEEAKVNALGLGGMLHPVLAAVTAGRRLRLEIRDHYFNVYYRGGSLMRVNGRRTPWSLHFDKEYFQDTSHQAPDLPTECTAANVVRWIEAFPDLMAGMDRWWTQHPQGERDHCQKIATENSGMTGCPPGDYLVLDLEYEYAKCRFDMIAARRRLMKNDATGWEEPELVFVEVKSEYGACSRVAGLEEHARDYQKITTAGNGQPIDRIKKEYENLISQKLSLGLLSKDLGFRCFAPSVPKLLLVFVDLDMKDPKLQTPLRNAGEILGLHGDIASGLFVELNSACTYVLRNPKGCYQPVHR